MMSKIGPLVVMVAILPWLLCTIGQTTAIETTITESWPTGFKGRFDIPLTDSISGGWTVTLTFDQEVTNFNIWQADVVSNMDNLVYVVKNREYNSEVSGSLGMGFLGNTAGSTGTTAIVELDAMFPVPAKGPDDYRCNCGYRVEILDTWSGNMKARVTIPLSSPIRSGWRLFLQFSDPVSQVQSYNARNRGTKNGGFTYKLRNWDYNANVDGELVQEFAVSFSGRQPNIYPKLSNQPKCACTDIFPTTVLPTTQPPTTQAPSTQLPTTKPSSTPSTEGTTTPAPATEPPDTQAPTTQPPATQAPKTQPPTTQAPETQPPATQAPETQPLATEAPTTQPSNTQEPVIVHGMPYPYYEVLSKSILFYEAQRSGDLPEDRMRVNWRKDSTLDDGSDVGLDLTGGWFDAGDYVKFGHPMAQSATTLAWGAIEFKDAYIAAGQMGWMLDCLKWATDYFVKCHSAPNEFYAQVGDGDVDHAYWGRPEDMNVNRPAWKVDPSKPGSDVAGETAAALAASSIVFRETDNEYADTLLQHARELYAFADTYRGIYSQSIPNAAKFYSSSSYGDELAWAAAWLYFATGEAGAPDVSYLNAAETHYQTFGLSIPAWAFDWDDKKAGVQLLLYSLTSNGLYAIDFQGTLDDWLPGHGVSYTPKGLAYRIQWGANRYSANMAFLGMVAAKKNLKPAIYRNFAMSQINYMLGDGGRSYVVGFGNNPPNAPHHASSSCPETGPCGWNEFHASGPNPHVLYGALVGGPDNNDQFQNDRSDYVQNEVTTDYNAGFQSAVAGIYDLYVNGIVGGGEAK